MHGRWGEVNMKQLSEGIEKDACNANRSINEKKWMIIPDVINSLPIVNIL